MKSHKGVKKLDKVRTSQIRSSHLRGTFPVLWICLLSLIAVVESAGATEILWSQYCQHLGKMKLLVHLDTDPTTSVASDPEVSKLWLRPDVTSKWTLTDSQPVDQLTATVLFQRESWPRQTQMLFKVTCGDSEWQGVFRAEPKKGTVLKLAALSCHKDIGWPWTEAIAELIAHDPDLVYFSGDQIYENDYGSPMFRATTAEDVPLGMANYLQKYRKFGEAFRELMRDRPTIMITDDHDVYANDLWGNGGVVMDGNRTTGGYPTHPDWVNAAEFTQTGHLPDPVDPGPHGDGVRAYYTALEYGGVHFAILEDRKFKSPPSEVIQELIAPPGFQFPKKRRTDFEIEVVLDPDYDCTKLDGPGLHLLGSQQESFLASWSKTLKQSGSVGAVLSQSPWAHVAMYSPTSADLDSNAWPQSGRNRALKAIGDAPVVMLHGDVHLGTLGRHGVEKFNDGPVSYSIPSFSSKASRRWEPLKPGDNREPGAPETTGEFKDRFGNKVTMYGAGNGLNGYGIVLFDAESQKIELQFHPMNEQRKPIKTNVPGWPRTLRF
ncbi:alkaline phosphatase D family protein [bacterium]|nr:alkaline phosphatase D family protein [bacterium]MDC0279057.1 alkaline phosphatase D family protein [bacterium]